MHLVISKRFEFSLAYRHYRPIWLTEKNQAIYGPMAGGEHGFGGNFTAFFVFHGPIDPITGMVINIAVIKERISQLLAARYDHKFLNRDTPPFDHEAPTPELVARQLLLDAEKLFSGEQAQLTACHLVTSPLDSATAYSDGRIERDFWLEFSAARRTWSPYLSDSENRTLFGAASSLSGHGHYYRLRAVLTGSVDHHTGMIVSEMEARPMLDALQAAVDHKNLSTDVPDLRGMPMTTECLARIFHDRLQKLLPVTRLRLWENPYLSIESLPDGKYAMVLESAFRAAHRLHSGHLSEDANRELYGKCNHSSGHGHLYRVEVSVSEELDKRSGTVFSLERMQAGLAQALGPWDYRHLDLDTDDFTDRPSTGENIVQTLWPRLEQALQYPLHRLRLWETPNNRFTLRRSIDA
jgi:6-pyruvoyltetrahydropterin/6-carboxytetrahydropterin synthase